MSTLSLSHCQLPDGAYGEGPGVGELGADTGGGQPIQQHLIKIIVTTFPTLLDSCSNTFSSLKLLLSGSDRADSTSSCLSSLISSSSLK